MKQAQPTYSAYTQEDMDALLANVQIPQTHEESADADLVIECVKEEMATKKELLQELDAFCKPETVFASNTSSLSITEMGHGLKHPVIGMHFFNPVPSMKLIEIIRGANTTQETFDFIYNLSKEIGKDPVEVAEAPGFVVNKILIPMINEAADLVYTGVATAEDVDKAMQLGANHPMGPCTWAIWWAWTCAWPSWIPCTMRPTTPSTAPACSCASWSGRATWAARPARDFSITASKQRLSRREQPGWTGARDANQGGPQARMFASRVAGKPGVASRRGVSEIQRLSRREQRTKTARRHGRRGGTAALRECGCAGLGPRREQARRECASVRMATGKGTNTHVI